MGQTAQNMLLIEEYLQEQADTLYKAYVEPLEEGYCIKKELFGEKELMQSYVVMNVLAQAAGGRRNLTSAHIQEVLALAKGAQALLFLLREGFLPARCMERFILHIKGSNRTRFFLWNFRCFHGKWGKLRKKHIRNGLIMIK